MSNPLTDAIKRSTEVLETLKRIKGEMYASRVTLFVSLTQIGAALGMPMPVVTGLLANLTASWGVDIRTAEGRAYMDQLITDAESFSKQTEIRG